MQRYKDLYKQQSLALSPRNFNEQNRELQKAARAKQREDRFQSNRIISVSPTPMKSAAPTSPSEDAQPRLTYDAPPKENQKPELASPPKKPTRPDLYLKRFLDWRASKKEQTKCEENAHRGQPLKSETLQNSKFTHKSGTFKPPPNLQQEQPNAPAFVPPKRHSLYAVIYKRPPTSTAKPNATTSRPQPTTSRPQPTTSRPHSQATTVQPHPTTMRPKPAATKVKPGPTTTRPLTAATTVKPHPTIVKQQPAATTVKSHPTTTRPLTAATTAKPQPTTTRPLTTATTVKPHATTVKRQPAATTVKPHPTTTRPQPVAVKSTRNLQPATVKPAPSHAWPLKPTTAAKPKAAAYIGVGSAENGVLHLPNVRTQPFEKPAVSKAITATGHRAEIVKPKPIRGGGGGGGRGAAGKFKPTAETKGGAAVPRNKPASQFSMRMKAKSNTSKYVNLQKNVRNRPDLRLELIEAATTELPPNTPLDGRTSGPALATSTQCKSHSAVDDFGDITSLSPVAPPSSHKDSAPEVPEEPKAKRKFDFSRYSMVETKAEDSLIMTPFLAKDDADPEDVTLKPAEETTPPRRVSDGKPNYLSPFVSVSRGKVNSRCEREKRNSMYLPGEETPVAIRRALESVLYFRLQLKNEIERLRAICSEWEGYSKENEAHLLDTGGMDMINVAIGQTNLLATKKMLQFSGLIDRCEAGATGKNHRPYDGSEETKPVQAEDLEGWWDMLRLQSENVDKRFDNLKRWKQNNWQDPDAVEEAKIPAKPVAKPKAKLGNNLKAKPKPKAKASSSLKQFLRRAHADMKKIKTDEASADNAQSTPSRISHQRVIVVRDRRSFSPARTVLRMSVGESRPSIGGNALLKSAILAAAEQNAMNHTPPPNKARQSILKTPGTSRRESRGVIFSTKKNVRRFKFTIDEGTVSDDEAVGGDKLEDCEEDMSLEASGERRSLDHGPAENQQQSEDGNTSRTYTLRNRRVRLRPSTEFM
ncbi:guanylate kinase-associated protein mars isoform X2 [Drosophila guanche]|uniref:guanylate kinase-associated protein mars isoform X2 n=1 Tax=Drosophila guanche TaxID=7266 RepID=UPI0014710A81|nr:guanylate kinase-associated protein mars isoform X2 [Drosophila guanche]